MSIQQTIIGSERSGLVRRRAWHSAPVLHGTGVFLPALLLIFAVLAFGATVEWAQFVLQTGAAVLMLFWAVMHIAGRPLHHNALQLPIAAVVLVASLQLVFRTSAYWYATKLELVQLLAYAAIFFVASQFWQDDSDRDRILKLLAAFGFLLAFFAIVQSLTSAGKLYWSITPRLGGAIYGPYVNRNHYAGIMELLAPVPFALAATRGKRIELRALLIFAGVLMSVSIFTSQSRAGMASFALEILLFCVVLLRIRRSIGTGVTAGITLIIFVMFIAWFGGGELFRRFSDLSDVTRMSVLRDSRTMFLERPLMGWGLGTFPAIYPHFRSFYTNLFINEAHNDFVQYAVETGLLGIAAGVWFLVAMYRSALRSLQNWTGSASDAAVLAGITGCTGLLFHSFFDFNLHIPANAMAFFLFAALATLGHSGDRKTSATGARM
jgi:O-antigen ligase